jgi:hypothetical protein
LELQRVAVTSSDIRSVGYGPESHILEVEFTSGGVYQYFGVPPSVHASLMQASSHGTYFASHIKKVYRYSKIG